MFSVQSESHKVAIKFFSGMFLLFFKTACRLSQMLLFLKDQKFPSNEGENITHSPHTRHPVEEDELYMWQYGNISPSIPIVTFDHFYLNRL